MPNNNPEGKNGWGDVGQHGLQRAFGTADELTHLNRRTAPPSATLGEILQGYADRTITGYEAVRRELDREYPGQYPMGRSTYFKRMAELSIVTPRTAQKRSELTEEEAYAAIIEEVHKDFNQKRGPTYIQETLKRRTIHVPV